jgi:hypothetical protein
MDELALGLVIVARDAVCEINRSRWVLRCACPPPSLPSHLSTLFSSSHHVN